MTPTQASETKKFPLVKTVIDLNTFSDIVLRKEYEFIPVASIQEAQAKLGNDTAKLLQVINDGLRAEISRQNRDSAEGWFLDDDGKIGDQVFDGAIAHSKTVNVFVLNLAKTMFEYNNDAPKAERDAAKKAAVEFIQSQPKMLEGLKRRSAEAFAAEAKAQDSPEE
jgi:hypothetical protein